MFFWIAAALTTGLHSNGFINYNLSFLPDVWEKAQADWTNGEYEGFHVHSQIR